MKTLKILTYKAAIEIKKRLQTFKVHLDKHTCWMTQSKLILFLSLFDTTVNLRGSGMHDTPVVRETPFAWKTMWEMC